MALFSKKNLKDRHNTGQISKYSKITVEGLEEILDTTLYFYEKESSINSSDMDGDIFSITGFSSIYVKIYDQLCAFFKMDKKNKRQWILLLSSGPKTLDFKLYNEQYNEPRYYTIDFIKRHSDKLKEILETVEKIK